MHLQLVTDSTPEWIIGEDTAGGDAWLVRTRAPRLMARVCHRSTLEVGTPSIQLGCGVTLAEVRWLGVPNGRPSLEELLLRADDVLGDWLQRQITRASRVA